MSHNTIIIILSCAAVSCHAVYLYSSFYAPLFDPRILNYRVEAPFDPEAGKVARREYVQRYGPRGERLVAELGRGGADISTGVDNKVYGDVKFYYTYPGASHAGAQ